MSTGKIFMGHTVQHCRLGLSQDSGFAEEFEDSNQVHRIHDEFSEVEYLIPQGGCERSKRQCLVQQNRKLFLWMLIYEWIECLLSIYGMR